MHTVWGQYALYLSHNEMFEPHYEIDCVFFRSLESFKLIVTFLNGAVLISAEHAKAVGQETRADVCWIAANVVSTRLCEKLIVTEKQMGWETYLEGSLSMASAAKEKEREMRIER